jgi:hypothetical protein
MRLPFTSTATIFAACALLAAFALPARANGYLEDSPWQFQSAGQLSAAVQMETMRQDKKGGLFNDPPAGSGLGSETSTSNIPIGNYTSITAGNGTTVTLTTNSSNGGTQTTSGELNGALH